MPATFPRQNLPKDMRFIPLNGALCLQQKTDWEKLYKFGFIPLNGALCLQPKLSEGVNLHASFIPLNGALCLQPIQTINAPALAVSFP